GVGVGHRAAGACVALIVGGDLECGGAVVVGGGREGRAVQGGVDVGERAGEGHERVGGAIAGGEGQAGRAAEGEGSVGRVDGDLHDSGARIDIGDGDQVSGGGGEGQRRVLVDRLRTGIVVDGRIIDRVDGDCDGLGVGKRAAGAGVPLVIGGDLDGGGAIVIL